MGVRKLNNKLNVISDNLKSYREENNLSQAKLCAKMQLLGIEMHPNDIWRIEANARTVKDFEVWGFAKIFKIKIEDLYINIEKDL